MSVFVVPFHHSSEILVSVVLKNCVETICTIACTAEQLLQLGLGLLGGDIKLCNPPEELTGLATPLIESQLQVMAGSSQMDLFRDGVDFKIDEQDASFKATGLRKTSYVIAGFKPEIAPECLKRCLGKLEGSLRSEFEQWAKD